MLPSGVTKYLFVNMIWVRELTRKLNTLRLCTFQCRKKPGYKTLDGKFATPMKFDTIKEKPKNSLNNINNNHI